jgi:hypothetical protein
MDLTLDTPVDLNNEDTVSKFKRNFRYLKLFISLS